MVSIGFRIRLLWQAHSLFSKLLLLVILTIASRTEALNLHHDLHLKLQLQAAPPAVIDAVQPWDMADHSAFSPVGSLPIPSYARPAKPGRPADKRMHIFSNKRPRPDGKVQPVFEGTIASEGMQFVLDFPGSGPRDPVVPGLYLYRGENPTAVMRGPAKRGVLRGRCNKKLCPAAAFNNSLEPHLPAPVFSAGRPLPDPAS